MLAVNRQHLRVAARCTAPSRPRPLPRIRPAALGRRRSMDEMMMMKVPVGEGAVKRHSCVTQFVNEWSCIDLDPYALRTFVSQCTKKQFSFCRWLLRSTMAESVNRPSPRVTPRADSVERPEGAETQKFKIAIRNNAVFGFRKTKQWRKNEQHPTHRTSVQNDSAIAIGEVPKNCKK
jgi:hypothetical protein